MRLIEILEQCLGQRAEKKFLPAQPGDVAISHADAGDLERDTGFRARVPLEVGIPRFMAWYREYYGV